MNGRRIAFILRAFPEQWRRENEQDLRETLEALENDGVSTLGLAARCDLFIAGLRIRFRRWSVDGAKVVALTAAAVVACVAAAFLITPSPQRLMLFLSAALVLAVVPGPSLVYVFTRTLHGGRRAGLQSTLGAAMGGLAHVVAAALGLSALLANSASAFHTVRLAGAVYLVVLGLQMMTVKAVAHGDSTTQEQFDSTSDRTIERAAPIRQGFVVEALNPKTALFFLSFIPQFIDHAQPVVPQFLMLGILSVVLNSAADVIIAVAAGSFAHRLQSRPRALRAPQRAAGLALVGLGGFVGFVGSDSR